MVTVLVIAIPILLIALIKLVLRFVDPPEDGRSLSELEEEIILLNAEWARAIEAAREATERESVVASAADPELRDTPEIVAIGRPALESI